jgi:hypothetical protein
VLHATDPLATESSAVSAAEDYLFLADVSEVLTNLTNYCAAAV